MGFEDARLGKGGFNLQNGGVGEEGLALGVAADVAAEAEGFQEGEGLFVDDVAGSERNESSSSVNRNSESPSRKRPVPARTP